MSLDECIHGLGPVSACTICNGREAKERAERNRIVARFPAAYEGHCYGCQDEISVGDILARTADGRYLCTDCAGPE